MFTYKSKLLYIWSHTMFCFFDCTFLHRKVAWKTEAADDYSISQSHEPLVASAPQHSSPLRSIPHHLRYSGGTYGCGRPLSSAEGGSCPGGTVSRPRSISVAAVLRDVWVLKILKRKSASLLPFLSPSASGNTGPSLTKQDNAVPQCFATSHNPSVNEKN